VFSHPREASPAGAPGVKFLARSSHPQTPAAMSAPSISRAARPRAFTLIELLTVIAIIGILAAIIIPVVGKVRDSARGSKSLSNLKSIGQAMLLHATEKKERLPTLHNGWAQPFWTTQIEPFLVKAHKQSEYSVNGAQATVSPIFFDPLVADGDHGTVSDYGANKDVIVPGNPDLGQGTSLNKIRNPSRLVLAATAAAAAGGSGKRGGSWYIETVAYVGDPTTNVRPDDRGKGNVLAVFADGHASSMQKFAFEEQRREFLLLNP
jgi:prepilin-type N-terminal cleavage/methylation domain-containing protein